MKPKTDREIEDICECLQKARQCGGIDLSEDECHVIGQLLNELLSYRYYEKFKRIEGEKN